MNVNHTEKTYHRTFIYTVSHTKYVWLMTKCAMYAAFISLRDPETKVCTDAGTTELQNFFNLFLTYCTKNTAFKV